MEHAESQPLHDEAGEPQPAAPATDTDRSCFEKARENGEPTFTVRARDPLAPIVTRVWADAQQTLRSRMAQGQSALAALDEIEKRLSHALQDYMAWEVPVSDLAKLAQVRQIAEAMDLWPGERKVAD